MRFLYLLGLLMAPVWMGENTGSNRIAAVLLKGIDVSHYQKSIEWDKVMNENLLDFAFVKATEGENYQDSLFCRNWASLRRLGLRRGAYHFFRADVSGYDQALLYLHTVEMEPGDLAPVLDVETLDGIAPDKLRREVLVWMKIVESRLDVRPILYTNQNFYERHLAGYFDDYPLWVARYSNNHPELSGRFWDFWQYTNSGNMKGIPEAVDMNIFTGTPAMLDRLCWFPAFEIDKETTAP